MTHCEVNSEMLGEAKEEDGKLCLGKDLENFRDGALTLGLKGQKGMTIRIRRTCWELLMVSG